MVHKLTLCCHFVVSKPPPRLRDGRTSHLSPVQTDGAQATFQPESPRTQRTPASLPPKPTLKLTAAITGNGGPEGAPSTHPLFQPPSLEEEQGRSADTMETPRRVPLQGGSTDALAQNPTVNSATLVCEHAEYRPPVRSVGSEGHRPAHKHLVWDKAILQSEASLQSEENSGTFAGCPLAEKSTRDFLASPCLPQRSSPWPEGPCPLPAGARVASLWHVTGTSLWLKHTECIRAQKGAEGDWLRWGWIQRLNGASGTTSPFLLGSPLPRCLLVRTEATGLRRFVSPHPQPVKKSKAHPDWPSLGHMPISEPIAGPREM